MEQHDLEGLAQAISFIESLEVAYLALCSCDQSCYKERLTAVEAERLGHALTYTQLLYATLAGV